MKRITAVNCDLPVVDRSSEVVVLQVLITLIQDVFFLLRMLSKALKLSPWGADDTTIVIAWVSPGRRRAHDSRVLTRVA